MDRFEVHLYKHRFRLNEFEDLILDTKEDKKLDIDDVAMLLNRLNEIRLIKINYTE